MLSVTVPENQLRITNCELRNPQLFSPGDFLPVIFSRSFLMRATHASSQLEESLRVSGLWHSHCHPERSEGHINLVTLSIAKGTSGLGFALRFRPWVSISDFAQRVYILTAFTVVVSYNVSISTK